jgi:transcription elongation factor Elf1
MNTFTCLACAKKSRVCEVKNEAGHTYLVCEHCSAEHVMKKIFGSPGTLPAIEAGALRNKDM